MSETIAILSTLDTKSEECAYLAEEIARLGGRPLLIDIGVVDAPPIKADISAEAVTEAGGATLEELRRNPSREIASEVMVKGATKVVLGLVTGGVVHGIVSLGGTQGTNNCTRVMQALPYGFPKLMVSTMASGDTSGFVGIKDITMMFSVADILGLNPLLRRILSNAAGAIVGMAGTYDAIDFTNGRPVIGITNLGVLTKGTMRAIEKFKEQGFETLVFHAVGSGGRAMEQLMQDGIINAVFDYALGDIVDAIGGGIRAADETRLTVAAGLGLPQVVVPGGTDHLGILLSEPNSLPAEFADRAHTYHNPVILVPRTNADELTRLADTVADRLNGAKGPIRVLMPAKGLSSYSVPGGPLEDPEADQVLAGALQERLSLSVEVIDAGAEDPDFVDHAVSTLLELFEQKQAA